MELTQLVFKTETSELERATKVLDELISSFDKFDSTAAKAASTKLKLAKAAKAEADATLTTAKAQEALNKANSSAVDAEDKKTKSVEKANKAIKEQTSILQRQKDIAEFQAEGFSKGQAGILATAKAAGQLSDELKRVLELQRTLMGTDPFDKSDLGVKSLSRALKEATDAQVFFNQGLNLSIDQARVLSRDLDKLALKGKTAGKSLDEIAKAQAEYTKGYVETASQYNRINEAEKAIIKQRKEVVSATNYVVDADRKLAAALNVTNNQLDKAGTDLLVKYETALRKSGLATDVVTKKLGVYKSQLAQVQAQEKKRQEQYLARALSPQLTDIGVSLYSGQAPLTVLLQQGGQIADLFRLSGVEAQNFGKAMNDAFKSMIPVMATVAKGMGQFVFTSLLELGKGFNSAIAGALGLTGRLDKLYMQFSNDGPSKAAANIARLGTVLNVVASVSLVGLIASLGVLTKTLYDISKAESELNKELVLTGARLGLTKKSAIEYAQSMKSAGVNTMKAMEAIAEISKSGKIGAESIGLVTKAAIDMEKYAGIAVSETIKQYAELSGDPTKVLIEFAKNTGLVSGEVIQLVSDLQRQGETAKAVKIAMEAMAGGMSSAVSQIKADASPLDKLFFDIKQYLSDMKQGLYDIAETDWFAGLARIPLTALESARNLVSDILTDFRSLVGAVKDLDIAKFAQLLSQLTPQGIVAKYASSFFQPKSPQEIEAERIRNGQMVSGRVGRIDERGQVTSAADLEKFNAESAVWLEKHSQALDKAKSKEQQYAEIVEKIREGVTKKYITEARALEYLEGYRKMIYGESKDTISNYYDTIMNKAKDNLEAVTGANERLTKSEVDLRKAQNDPEWLKLSEQKRKSVEDEFQKVIAVEKQKQATEDLAAAEQFRLSVLGKEDGLGNYYKQIAALEKHAERVGWSREQIEEMTRAIFNATPAMREYNKALEDANKAAFKYESDSISFQASIAKQNSDLDFRVSLLGKTEEQQRALNIENQRSVKITEADVKLKEKLRNIEEDIAKAKRQGLEGTKEYQRLLDAREQMYLDHSEQVRAINRETSVIYREDMQKEFDRIRNGISDSLVTALFEGGKAGSKKLRDLLINELKKPVTLVVNAVVNTLLGTALGGLGGLLGIGGTSGTSGGGGFLGALGNALSATRTGMSLWSGLTSGQGFLGGLGSTLGISQGAGAVAAYNAGTISAAEFASLAGGAAPSGFMSGLGSAMPWIAGGLAALAAFGAFRSKKIVGGGIMGELGGDQALRDYALERKGGYLFGGPDYRIKDLGESAQSKAIQDMYKAMRQNTVDMARSLGLDTTSIEDYRTGLGTQIHPDTGARTGVDLRGLSAEEAQAKIAEALRTANNEMAQQILGTWERTTEEVTRTVQDRVGDPDNWDFVSRTVTETIETITYTASEYAKEGEEAIDTLTRLATSLGTVNAVFDSLGYTLFQGSLAGADLASKLVDAFGSIENFTNATSAYYDAFYSEQEKQDNLVRSLTNQLAKYNLTLPKTREEYRSLVEAQDLSTESGREMYAFLVNLAPAFDAIADSAEAAADAMRSQYESALEAAYSALETAVSAQRDILQTQANAQQEVVNKLRSMFDFLSNNVRELYLSVTSTSTMLASQGRDIIANAISTGNLPDLDTLTNAVNAVKQDVNTTLYATKFEQDKARLLLAAELLTLQDQTENQLSIEELTLQGIKDQIDYLDKLLQEARRQVDAALGVQNAVLSVADALAALTALLALPPTTANTNPTGFVSGPGDSGITTRPPSNTNPFVIGGGSQDYYLEQYTRSLEWGNARDDALSSSDLYAYAQANGFSQSDIANVLGLSEEDVRNHFDRYGIPAFAGGGLHSGGLRLVGENSPELEITGSARYMNAPQMYDMLTQGVASENEGLKEQVSLLRAELRANVTHTAKLVKALDRVTVGTNEGEALRTSAVV